jgi:hypothetical protein
MTWLVELGVAFITVAVWAVSITVLTIAFELVKNRWGWFQ